MLNEVPTWWFQAGLWWLLLVGLLLWLFGRRLLQPGFGLLGLGIGALVTLAATNAFGIESTMYWVIGGALGGALVLGLLLWRLVLALTVAAAVMLAAPWGVIAFNGWPMPAVGEPIAKAAAEVRGIVTGSSGESGEPESGEGSGSAAEDGSDSPSDSNKDSDSNTASETEADSSQSKASNSEATDSPTRQAAQAGSSGGGTKGKLAKAAAMLSEPLVKARKTITENVKTWWSEDLSRSQRQALLGACISGGVLALLLSLALPGFMASLVTALLGAALVYAMLIVLLPPWLPQWLSWFSDALAWLAEVLRTSGPRRITIGLIAATVLGMMLQTFLMRSKPET